MGISKVEYCGNTLIDLSADTVTPETLLEGATAHNAAGEEIVGVATTGDDSLIDSLIDRSITEINSNADNIGSHAFRSCIKLVSANFPNAKTMEPYAFQNCNALANVNFPVLNSIGNYAFQMTYGFSTIDFPMVNSIGAYAFNNSNIGTLILRSETVCTLSNTNAFSTSPIASGTGYIYIPASLVDSYRAATNWSAFADQFRAIEDYPEITGGAT